MRRFFETALAAWLTTFFAGSLARADTTVGPPLGSLYPSFSPTSYQKALHVPPYEYFNFWVVADVDFGDVGLPDENTVNGISGFESLIRIPSEVTLTVQAPYYSCIGCLRREGDSWIASFGTLLPAAKTPYFVMRFAGIFLSPASDVVVHLGPSESSSVDGVAPAWFQFSGTEDCEHHCLRPFREWGRTIVINCSECPLVSGTRSWSTLKAGFRVTRGDENANR